MTGDQPTDDTTTEPAVDSDDQAPDTRSSRNESDPEPVEFDPFGMSSVTAEKRGQTDQQTKLEIVKEIADRITQKKQQKLATITPKEQTDDRAPLQKDGVVASLRPIPEDGTIDTGSNAETAPDDGTITRRDRLLAVIAIIITTIVEAVGGSMSDEEDDYTDDLPEGVGDDDSLAVKFDRIAYGLFGHLFRGKDTAYSDFNRKLNQARIALSYDIYLSRVMFYALGGATIGVLIGICIAILLSSTIAGLKSGIMVPPAVYAFVSAHQVVLGAIALSGALGGFLFILIVALLYYYPFYIAGERKREIDAMLPHAVTFMYAMSRGGVNVVEVLRAVADAEDSYGEVAREFEAIINNVDYMKEDLRTAVLAESHETPSDGMRDFLEDLLNVVDTGSDMEQFFLNKADLYLERARYQQKQTLDTLEIMSESYVTVFVASPIFILIILVVMSMMGGADIKMLYAMTYFGLPMGGIMFSIIIKLISTTGTEGMAELKRNNNATTWSNLDIDREQLEDDPRYAHYKRIKTQQAFTDKLFAPVKIMRETPLVSLVVTVPIAGVYIAWVSSAGLADLTLQGFLDAPVWQTIVLVYLPILMTFGVLSGLHEVKARREAKILKRLPEAFKSASDANERGLTVEESFAIVATNSEGALSAELRYAVNETTWTGDLNDALVQFANKLSVPRLSRTIKLITKANEVSGDIQSVLTVAARDVENMYKLDAERKQNAFTYIVIIIVSFLVSMGVIAMLDSTFLSEVGDNPAFSGGGDQQMQGGMGGGAMPIDEFRMAFLHTVMVLGGASGLVAGTMSNNDPISGVKYSLAMMGLALAVFAFI